MHSSTEHKPQSQLSLAVGDEATSLRRSLELLQRFPSIALHEELCGIKMECVDTRSAFGPSLVDILQASPLAETTSSQPSTVAETVSTDGEAPQQPSLPPPLLFQGVNPEWDVAVDAAITRLATVDRSLLSVSKICNPNYGAEHLHSAESKEVQRRIRNYLLDDGTSTSSLLSASSEHEASAAGGISSADLSNLLSDATVRSDGMTNNSDDVAFRKRPREEDVRTKQMVPTTVAGLVAAESAIAVDQSLRNHVSLSMPRRKHAHAANDRLCICPVFSQPIASSHYQSDPSILYLDKVMDPTLAHSLDRILASVGDVPERELHSDLNLMHSVEEALQLSEAKVRDMKQRKQRGPLHEMDRKLLDSQHKMIGVNLPEELRATSLSDEQVLSVVKNVMSLYLGTDDVSYMSLKFLTFYYKRQTMSDLSLYDGGGAPSDPSEPANTKAANLSFRTLDGKLLPNMDSVREAQRQQEEHLRFCGVVDQVEEYSTVIVVVFLVDPAFIRKVSDPTDAGELVGVLTDIRAAKKEVFQTPTHDGHGVVTPAGVVLPLGVSVTLPAESLTPTATLSPISNIPTIFLTSSVAINQYRSRGVVTTKADFCCSRDHFEMAMVVKHLQEFYETVLVERLVRITQTRLLRLPVAKNYDDQVKLVFARCMSLPPKDQIKALQQAVWDLQQQPQFAVLFAPGNELCISLEAEEWEDVMAAYKEDLSIPPSQRSTTTTTAASSSAEGSGGKAAPFRKPFLPSEHAIVGCLRLLCRLWGKSNGRRKVASGQLSAYAEGRGDASSFPVSRLRNLMIATLVSPNEVNELLAEISLASLRDPSLAFELRNHLPASSSHNKQCEPRNNFKGQQQRSHRSYDDDDDANDDAHSNSDNDEEDDQRSGNSFSQLPHGTLLRGRINTL